jgi:multidrug efflux system membrane fusion protein
VAEDNLDQVRSEILHHSSLPVDAFDRTRQTKIATGKLLTLDNEIDSSTGTVRFRGQFENSDLELYPNQFVKTVQELLRHANSSITLNLYAQAITETKRSA